MRNIQNFLIFMFLIFGQVLPAQIIGITASQLKTGTPLLGDDYPGMSVAYSLRKINSGYTGHCIQIKRTSDNATSNIDFDGEGVDEAAITSFCSGTTGYVITWYDQSGNGYNLTTTATDYYIYQSGALITLNGKIAIANTAGTTPLASASVAGTIFYSGTTSISNTGLIVYSAIAGKFSIGISHSGNAILQYVGPTSTQSSYRVYNNSSLNYGTSLPSAGTQMIIQAEFNSGANTSDYWINGSSVDTGDAANTGTPGSGVITVGQYGSNAFYLCDKLQEIVIWPSYVGDLPGIYSNASAFWN